jgi:5-hydroxyisourate hydrolase
MSITTHVLDTSRGKPADGVPVRLEVRDASGGWFEIGHGTTDADGRLKGLVPSGIALESATYRLTFDTRTYFESHGRDGFYPECTISFSVRDPTQHYHVPLLLSPFGYSTYRGS